MPHHKHTPEILNHEAAPVFDVAADDLRTLGGLPVRGNVVLDYKKPEQPSDVDLKHEDSTRTHEIDRVESQAERERREAYEEYHEQLRIPEMLRRQAMDALTRTLAACREEFVGFDEQLVAQATARLMAIIDDTPTPPHVRSRSDSDGFIPPAEYVVRERLHQKLLNVKDGSVYKILDHESNDSRAVREAALKAMRHHPLYQLFEATISESERPDSRKRTQLELQTALAQAEQEVKRRHGLAPHDDLRLHHGARRVFERQAWQIEDEDIPHATHDKDDAHSKVFSFFVNMLPEEKRSEFRRAVGALKAMLPRDSKVSNDSGTAKPLLDQLHEAIDAYEASSSGGYEEVDFLIKRFMKSRAMIALLQELQYPTLASSDYLLTARSLELFSKEAPWWVSRGDTYSERVERILDERIDYLDPLLRNRIAVPTSSPGVFDLRPIPSTHAERVRQMSIGPSVPISVQDSLDAQDYGFEPDATQAVMGKGVWSLSGRNFYVEPSSSESANYDLASLESQMPLAHVHYADTLPGGIPQTMRLIQPTLMPDMTDVSRVKNHMTITPWNAPPLSPDSAYTVAGFTLEWASNGNLHFAYDVDHDPYTRAKVPLPEGSGERLVAAYKEAGLDELARLVDQASIRTVDQLEGVLKWGAEYAQKGNGKRVTTKTLTELAEAYKNDEGRLSYQCTGAAQLLRLSLQELYGKDSVSVIAGSVLVPGADTIGVIGHAQVKFVSPEDGRVYYLDATPRGSEIDIAEGAKHEAYEPIHSQAPVEAPTEWLEEAKTLLEEHKQLAEAGQIEKYTKDDADAAVVAIRESRLLPMAGAWLGIQPTNKKSRDELYRKLLDLQNGDPLRSTLELTHQIPAGTAEVTQLARLKVLLDTIGEHPANSPIFKRIKRYSKPQLDALSAIVSEVEATYAAVAEEKES